MNKKHNLESVILELEKNGLLKSYDIERELLQTEITALTDNSKDISKNALFVCKGAHFKSEYLEEAINEGAVCFVTQQKDLAESFKPHILVNDIRKSMSILGNFYYDKAWEKFTLIGITGTKGKSTTSYFVKSILDNYLEKNGGKKAAILSSIENYDGSILEESHLTTPEPLSLHRHFANIRDNNIKYCVMEVSSQALKYDRVSGVQFDIGCFLNIGEDHISEIEHSDFEDYFSSKTRIFHQADKMIVSDQLNFDEIGFDEKAYSSKTLKFGESECSYSVKNIKKQPENITFQIMIDNETHEFEIGMAGLFNVQNATAAIAICSQLSIPIEDIKEGIKSARVSGRMEVFYNEKRNISAIVDYAHNKLSFEKLFESTKKEYPGMKIISVFGCPGGKAFARRKDLAEVAGKNSDLIIVTEEDHGEEELSKICSEIETNVLKYQSNCVVILDRESAIKKAIEYFEKDAVLLITGKGRETRQKRGVLYIDTPSDFEIVEKNIMQ